MCYGFWFRISRVIRNGPGMRRRKTHLGHFILFEEDVLMPSHSYILFATRIFHKKYSAMHILRVTLRRGLLRR